MSVALKLEQSGIQIIFNEASHMLSNNSEKQHQQQQMFGGNLWM